MKKIKVHTKNLTNNLLNDINGILSCKLVKTKGYYYGHSAVDILLIKKLSNQLKIDISVIPANFDGTNVKLIISDMDSTLINIECIDEIAAFANLKPEVAKITERAMRGELDFNQSLIKRVKLLKSLPMEVLDKVYQQKLQLNQGAEELIQTAKSLSVKFALVSGGFDFFTKKLHNKLNIDFSLSNKLTIKNQKLSGEVTGNIINANEKQKFLLKLCDILDIKPSQTIAIGDGSNDLMMMEIAGLSVAYKAKSLVQAKTDVQINYGNLDSVLDFLD